MAAQNHSQVGGPDVYLISLGDVFSSTQVNPSQSSSLADMSEASLELLAASAQEPLADRALESAAVPVESLLPATRLIGANLVGQALPSASPLRSPFRDAGHVALPVKLSEGLGAVVTAVSDDLFDGEIRVGSLNSRLRTLQGLVPSTIPFPISASTPFPSTILLPILPRAGIS